MNSIRYFLVLAGLSMFTLPIARAEGSGGPEAGGLEVDARTRSEVRCEIRVDHRVATAPDAPDPDTQASIVMSGPSLQSWSTAVFLGKAPLDLTVGLSVTNELPDVLVAEIATGHQQVMARGPGHAAPGTLLETTRVRFAGRVQIIFDLPRLGVEIVCDPFA